eukprot:jgi/Astpho2/5061/Aster-05983
MGTGLLLIRGGCAMGVAACGDQACSWSVVHSWQATVAGPWPPVGGCALARPGMRISPVSAARNLQTHWLSFCALAGAQGSLHGDQTWLGMLSRCATHLPQHQWSIGGISFAPWVWLQAFLQLTSRKYSGTRMGPGLLQSALNLQTSAAAAMPSVLVTSVPGLGKPQYVAAQRTGLSSSMHWAWAWKRAATLAQCTANGYVPNSAYTAAAGQEAAPNTNATEHCPQHIPWHSVEGFAEIHKTAVELSPFTAALVLQSMEDIVLITGALGRSCILEQVCRQAIMARCLTALGPPQGSFNLCGSDVSVQLCRIRGRMICKLVAHRGTAGQGRAMAPLQELTSSQPAAPLRLSRAGAGRQPYCCITLKSRCMPSGGKPVLAITSWIVTMPGLQQEHGIHFPTS